MRHQLQVLVSLELHLGGWGLSSGLAMLIHNSDSTPAGKMKGLLCYGKASGWIRARRAMCPEAVEAHNFSKFGTLHGFPKERLEMFQSRSGKA